MSVLLSSLCIRTPQPILQFHFAPKYPPPRLFLNIAGFIASHSRVRFLLSFFIFLPTKTPPFYPEMTLKTHDPHSHNCKPFIWISHCDTKLSGCISICQSGSANPCRDLSTQPSFQLPTSTTPSHDDRFVKLNLVHTMHSLKVMQARFDNLSTMSIHPSNSHHLAR